MKVSDFLQQMFALFDQTIVVTGGTGVLGQALVRAFLGAGAKQVVITSRDAERAAAIAAAIDPRVIGVKCDVTDFASIAALPTELAARGITAVHTLVNAAGGNMKGATLPPGTALSELDLSEFDGVMRLNCTGTVGVVRALVPLLVSAGDASVINISSMSAEIPLTRVFGYSASKAAVNNATGWLATHFAQERERLYNGSRIRVNAIAPGFVLTEQNWDLLVEKPKLKELPDTTQLSEALVEQFSPRAQAILQQTPFGRLGKAEELQGVVVLLASAKAAPFITGEIIAVDGGYSSFSV